MLASSSVSATPSRGTAARLRQALTTLADGYGRILSHEEKSWASATFAGTRHRLQMEFEDDTSIAAGERWIALLPDHEFTLPGQLVADAAIVAVDHEMVPTQRLRVTAELLLLEEG